MHTANPQCAEGRSPACRRKCHGVVRLLRQRQCEQSSVFVSHHCRSSFLSPSVPSSHIYRLPANHQVAGGYHQAQNRCHNERCQREVCLCNVRVSECVSGWVSGCVRSPCCALVAWCSKRQFRARLSVGVGSVCAAIFDAAGKHNLTGVLPGPPKYPSALHAYRPRRTRQSVRATRELRHRVHDPTHALVQGSTRYRH